MEPITTTLIATALANGLFYLGNKVLEDGLLSPKLEPLTKRLTAWVQRKPQRAEADQRLQAAVESAFVAIGAPSSKDQVEQYLLSLGFDQFRAERNDALRQEMARAVLMMVEPQIDLIPDGLLRSVRWPSSNRQLLADFLHQLHSELAAHPDYGALIAAADNAAVRQQLAAMQFDLARTAQASERAAAYLAALLTERGIAPDKPDAEALADYQKHVLEMHSHISFLFIRPMGRSSRLRTEAELETVFVPLEVDDPDETTPARSKQRSRSNLTEPEMDAERRLPLAIDQVLARYPVFLLKGSPGCGKTTLLRHVARCFATGQAAEALHWTGKPLLPILTPLRNFGRFLADHRAEFTSPAPGALRKFIEDYFVEHEVQLPAGFFRRRLEEGGCLLLLDGLDEVADRDLRATVAQMVSAFIKHYEPLGNRFGLASRPKGYDEVAPYLPKPVVCTVQPLTPESRDDLVRNLLHVLELDALRCRSDMSELLADIRSKEKVDELSRNPLFCTTLVLVYKYRGAALPERRVDVYHELVELLLGFWETHKAGSEGVSDVRELVLLDGTGRAFLDERDAVEAKRRALVDLASWMQQRKLAEVSELRAAARLARYFRKREGANRREDGVWACRFLAVAHQRSGLLIEAQPGLYAFSHQNFREYLAASALIGQRDQALADALLRHAGDSWWEEVILLAAAHPLLSDDRREFLVQTLLDGGHLLLAGRCAVDAGARLPAPLRSSIQQQLHGQMVDGSHTSQDRYAAGLVLDEMGWLPPDLNRWLRCGDLIVMKYPLTNAHFAPFVEGDGYSNPAYWGGEQNDAWRWRVRGHDNYRGKDPVSAPEYWHDLRLGKERHAFPLVGISWYEATAYAAWLSSVLQRVRRGDEEVAAPLAGLVADLLAVNAQVVRLPSQDEWLRCAGGAQGDRYPWDPPQGPATIDKQIIAARANTKESQVSGPSPVAMHPQGASQPFGLIDLAGNVWEWTASWYDAKNKVGRTLWGGSWANDADLARCGVRGWYYPFPRLTPSVVAWSPPLFLAPDF